jgi:hypothetical protein
MCCLNGANVILTTDGTSLTTPLVVKCASRVGLVSSPWLGIKLLVFAVVMGTKSLLKGPGVDCIPTSAETTLRQLTSFLGVV